VTCRRCNHTVRKFGTYGKRHIQRYRCTTCKITFSEPESKFGTHYTDPEAVSKALAMMLEGMSIRAISRLTGLHKHTILEFMKTAAVKARIVLDSKVQNITPRYVQMDELWGFVHTREHNKNEGDSVEWGSVYLWLAIDSESKLLITHHFGDRNSVAAHQFIGDLRKRTVGRYQASSDQLPAYVGAMRNHFGANVDFGQLHKIYGKLNADNWYGGGQVIGAVPHVKIGRPDYSRISTSHVERANLSVRMHLRRLTRLTNAFSKKLENLKDAVTLYVAFYNFCRVHQTLKATPAMAAGLSDHVWSVSELLS
jgi:IS1 family transposase